jgi:hypothetical protein
LVDDASKFVIGGHTVTGARDKDASLRRARRREHRTGTGGRRQMRGVVDGVEMEMEARKMMEHR